MSNNSTKNRKLIFIQKARKKYLDLYDYSQVNYIKSNVLVTIKCNTCNQSFQQTPSNHLHGYNGCKTCSVKNRKKLNKPQDQCISDFIEVHGDKYDYSLVEYVNWKTKVKIICKDHGVFEQEPNSHRSGYGCKKCSAYSLKFHGVNISDLENKLLVFYIAKFKSDKYQFIKVGITSRDFERRFKPKKYQQYNKEVLLQLKLPSIVAIHLENDILKAFEKHRYYISEKSDSFKGMTEIFKISEEINFLFFVGKYLQDLYMNEHVS